MMAPDPSAPGAAPDTLLRPATPADGPATAKTCGWHVANGTAAFELEPRGEAGQRSLGAGADASAST